MSVDPAVLLISPGIVQWTDMDFGLPHLVALGGYLRQHTGVRVEILDLNYEGGDHATLAQRLDELGPFLLVGLSCYSSYDYPRVMALARFLKGALPDVPLVTGGYHASALPEDVVFDGSPFDAVVLGEGERPIRTMVESLLGGGGIDKQVWPHDLVEDLDTLPPYAWDLLDRYWPHARDLGRKLQVYLSRGCSYHCTFCMERAKSGYTWRAYSPERAVDELVRLNRKTDLSHWIVNLADPLFGFRRSWRRQVLQGILDAGIQPRQFWTLTRSDDLDDTDVQLLAKARFSIGIGLESGSPRMLQLMQKGNTPDRYKAAILRLARLSRVHGLNWATNVIVGHPGETPETLRETHAFLTELFTTAPETCGWLSIDPFRLYPGSQVHQEQAAWSRDHGTVFHHPVWWKSWYDTSFRAQHLDPSRELSYEDRVNFMYDAYAPLVAEVQRRFRGQGRDVDRTFDRSLAQQRSNLSEARRQTLLKLAKTARSDVAQPTVAVPLGLHLKDPWIRLREEAVRRLLDRGVLRTHALIEALLQTPPERYLLRQDAERMLQDKTVTPLQPGLPPAAVPLRLLAIGLEALEPAAGDTLADLGAVSGYVAALMAHLVGPEGQVLACHPCRMEAMLQRQLADLPQVELRTRPLSAGLELGKQVDGIWLGAALPKLPRALLDSLRDPEGRAITFLGPRFRDQDLVALTRHGSKVDERILTTARVAPLGGPGGWFAVQRDPTSSPIAVKASPAPAQAMHVLAHLDLGQDAASLHDPALTAPWAEALREAYAEAPGRLALHALALQADEVSTLLSLLRTPPPALSDPAGRRLCERFAAALQEVDPPAVQAPDPAHLLAGITPVLQRVREHLWQQQRRTPPPLTLLHAPALGKRARGTLVAGVRRVATDLHQPVDHVLMQVLHEEVHPITDPLVWERHGTVTRDTRIGSPGHALHAELETTAVAATQALLTALAPHAMPAFERWRVTVGA